MSSSCPADGCKNAAKTHPAAPAQLFGTMAKGMAAATLDGEYLARFRARPHTYRGRLMAGVQAAAVGVYEGVVGARHIAASKMSSDEYLMLQRSCIVSCVGGS